MAAGPRIYEGYKSKKDIDFNEYVPVFIYAHGELPRYNDMCRSGEHPTNFKKLKKIKSDGSNMFINIPENMILVDPMTQGLYCFSGVEMEVIFPEIIKIYGNNKFLKEAYSPEYAEYSSTLGHYVLKDLYAKTKLYYSGEEIPNYYTAFTDNQDFLHKYSIFTFKTDPVTNLFSKEYIEKEWFLKFNNKNSDYGCVFLEDVFTKLRKHFGPSQKLIIYLISCRGVTKPYAFEKAGKMDLYYKTILKQEEIHRNGVKNINELRPIKFTGRVTRGTDARTAQVDPDEHSELIKYYEDIKKAAQIQAAVDRGLVNLDHLGPINLTSISKQSLQPGRRRRNLSRKRRGKPVHTYNLRSKKKGGKRKQRRRIKGKMTRKNKKTHKPLKKIYRKHKSTKKHS